MRGANEITFFSLLILISSELRLARKKKIQKPHNSIDTEAQGF
jgi:hypothetical protein